GRSERSRRTAACSRASSPGPIWPGPSGGTGSTRASAPSDAAETAAARTLTSRRERHRSLVVALHSRSEHALIGLPQASHLDPVTDPERAAGDVLEPRRRVRPDRRRRDPERQRRRRARAGKTAGHDRPGHPDLASVVVIIVVVVVVAFHLRGEDGVVGLTRAFDFDAS